MNIQLYDLLYMAYMTIVTYNDNSSVLKIGYSGSFIDLYIVPRVSCSPAHTHLHAHLFDQIPSLEDNDL